MGLKNPQKVLLTSLDSQKSHNNATSSKSKESRSLVCSILFVSHAKRHIESTAIISADRISINDFKTSQ